jgi:hypothetical protein
MVDRSAGTECVLVPRCADTSSPNPSSSVKKANHVSCLPSIPNLPNATHYCVNLLVDTRERKDQHKYREFFHRIRGEVQKRCANRSDAREWMLPLADFMVVLDSRDDGPVSPIKNTTIKRNHASQEQVGLSLVYSALIERKALTDLIQSSSESMTARHYTQERRLRYSGVAVPVFMVEGVYSAGANIKPFQHGAIRANEPPEGEPTYWQADVVQDYHDVINYFAHVIARNVGAEYVVFVMQTNQEVYTSLFLSAMVTCANAHLRLQQQVQLSTASSNVNSSAFFSSYKELSVFSKFASGWGGDKRGRQSVLRSELTEIVPDIDVGVMQTIHPSLLTRSPLLDLEPLIDKLQTELVELIIRRFGDHDAVHLSMDACVNDFNRIYLLKDLSTSCSNVDLSSLTRLHVYLEAQKISELDPLLTFLKNNLSLLAAQRLLRQSASNSRHDIFGVADVRSGGQQLLAEPLPRVTSFAVSEELYDLLDHLNGFPDYIHPVRCRPNGPVECAEFLWGSIQTIDTSFQCTRMSSVIEVIVVPGMQVISCLLSAMTSLQQTCKGKGGEDDLNVVRYAVTLLTSTVDAFISQHEYQGTRADDKGVFVQRVYVFENLIGRHARAGALVKLGNLVGEKEIAVVSSSVHEGNAAPFLQDPRISLFCHAPKHSRKRAAGVKDGKDDDNDDVVTFPLPVAQRLVAHGAWYIYLLFACVMSEKRVQVFQSANDEETKIFISSLLRASNDSALLLY